MMKDSKNGEDVEFNFRGLPGLEKKAVYLNRPFLSLSAAG